MAPFAQDGGISVPTTTTIMSTVTPTVSYSTKGSKPSPISSITTVSSSFTTATATPTYISQGSPAPTHASLRGSQPPSKLAIQGSTLAFVSVLTLLWVTALGFLAWNKGWGFRNTVVVPPPQHPKLPVLQRNNSNATLMDESSLERHRGREA